MSCSVTFRLDLVGNSVEDEDEEKENDDDDESEGNKLVEDELHDKEFDDNEDNELDVNDDDDNDDDDEGVKKEASPADDEDGEAEAKEEEKDDDPSAEADTSIWLLVLAALRSRPTRRDFRANLSIMLICFFWTLIRKSEVMIAFTNQHEDVKKGAVRLEFLRSIAMNINYLAGCLRLRGQNARLREGGRLRCPFF